MSGICTKGEVNDDFITDNCDFNVVINNWFVS